MNLMRQFQPAHKPSSPFFPLLALLWILFPSAVAWARPDGLPTTAPLPRAELRIPRGGGAVTSLRVEVADTVAARARGLMFRQNLADENGMLLLWQRPRRVSIWMKNTLIPLDIVFIGADWRIARIHRGARPLDTTLIPSRSPVLAVLEIRAGMADRLRLAPGMRLRPASLPQPSVKRNAAPAKSRRPQ